MAPTLADLDARSRHWPLPGRLCYLTVKWGLVALGAYLMLALAYQQWTAGQFGLGIGVIVSLVFALVLGVVNAMRGVSADPSSPRQSGPR